VTKPLALISINSSWNIINFRRGLVAGLQDAGFRVAVIAPDDGHGAAIRDLGVDFHAIDMDRHGRSPFRDAALTFRYRRLLARIRPDAYLGYTIKPNIYGSLAAQSLGIPVVNNVAGLGVVFLKQGPINRLVRSLYKAAFRRSRHVFFQNRDDLAAFTDARLVPTGRTSLLPGSGVDLAHFRPRLKQREDEEFVFLLVSRLLRAKGIAEYVDAAARIRSIHPSTRFRIAGILEHNRAEAITAGELEAWQDSGSIEFLGALSDVREALASADCVVLPSYYPEGTPRSLLEAAASAKPIVTCDVPGCREVVQEGVNGFLCRPRSVNDLERALTQVLALDPETLRRFALASRTLAETRFDEQIVVGRYVETIRSVLGARTN
jgi:glycosyltransferase involved in cell wall biosynthesis